MFAQHEQILRAIHDGLGHRVAQLEHGHLEAAQVVSSVASDSLQLAAGIQERVAADAGLRQELVEFAGKLQASEDNVKAVHNEFG